MTDVGTITARVIALMGDVSGVGAVDDEYPATMSTLPFCFVEEGPAAFVKSNSNNITVTQEFTLLLYVQQFETEITGQEDSAYQACRPFLTSVPKHFWQHTRLQRNDQGLADVVQVSLSQHQGIQSASRDDREYMGVAFTLNVVYDQYVEEV
jgi:hypothetical protein